MLNLMTKEDYDKLVSELHYYKKVRREELKESLKFACDLGDLRENAEYDAAIMEYDLVETKIYKLEQIINNSSIIESYKKYILILDDENVTYTLSFKSDIDNNIISYNSELGKVLSTSLKGDIIKFNGFLINVIDVI